MKVVALSGGVGGAKILLGLYRILPPGSLTAIVNVADDFEWHGLHISPDLDTALYALAGLSDYGRGWGIAGDTFNMLEALRLLGEPSWFAVGDRDLATHILRTRWLAEGLSLSEVTARFTDRLRIAATILPATNETLRTWIRHPGGVMAFQEYFVLNRWQTEVEGVEFQGSGCDPTPGVLQAIEQSDLFVVGPSNPVVSIWPILHVKGVRDAIYSLRSARVGISPIVGGSAVSGPAGKLLKALGYQVSAAGVAQFYSGLLTHFVIHRTDTDLVGRIESLGMRVLATDIIMGSLESKARLAEEILQWVLN
jgi:LPPG:FO 2-phospho-L-lactate transferase